MDRVAKTVGPRVQLSQATERTVTSAKSCCCGTVDCVSGTGATVEEGRPAGT